MRAAAALPKAADRGNWNVGYMVVLNAGLGFFKEGRAQATFDTLSRVYPRLHR